MDRRPVKVQNNILSRIPYQSGWQGLKKIEDSCNSMGFSEEEANVADNRREDEWKEVKRKMAKHKRIKKGKISLGETESEEREEEGEDPKARPLNAVIRFEGEGGVKKMDPLKPTKSIRAQIGEVKYAWILGDGNLLIGCNSDGQIEKARKLGSVGKVKVLKVVKVREQRTSGGQGVISRVPLSATI